MRADGPRLFRGALATVLALTLSAGAGWAGSQEPADRVWRTDRGLPQNSVTAIVQDPTGYLWLGTQEGVVRFDGSQFTVFDRGTTPELGHNFVSALAVDPSGALWIGTRGGLTRYREGRFERFGAELGLPSEVVGSLTIGPEGRLWVGTRAGLARLDGDRFETLGRADGLPNENIQALWTDPRGRLWVGTEGGAAYLDPDSGRFVAFTVGQGLSDDFVISLGPGPAGETWVATMNGGVNRFAEDSLEPLGVEPDLANQIVFASRRDTLGNLWLGTRTGLLQVSKNRRLDVANPETAAGDTVLSLFEDRRGDLWIGTAKSGLRLHRTAPRGPDPESVPVLVESVQSGPRTWSASPKLRLEPESRDLEVRFTAIDFVEPDRLRFRHRLEGFDQRWVEDGTQRFASYTNLPPGSYRFRVESLLAGRDAPVGGALLEFRISPYFYETVWFRTLALLLLLSLGLYVYRLRVHALDERRRRLEATVGERTDEILQQKDALADTNRRLEFAHRQLTLTNQELKALSREKADFLAIATHDLRAPLVNLKGFSGELRMSLAEAKSALEPVLPSLDPELRRSLEEAFEEDLEEALSFIDTAAERMEALIAPVLKLSRLSRRELHLETLDLRRLVLEVVEQREPRRRALGATIRVGLLPSVHADAASMREIFGQLLDNALAYGEVGRPPRIEIFHQERWGRDYFHVRDNGRGIPEDQRAKVFRIFGRGGLPDTPGEGMGLVYVRTLIHRHGGRIWYESTVGGGSTFSFVLGEPESQPTAP
ncbi:MAG: hypothetical protein KDD11_11440 [Acidobacteria bacterium]|nr:hypothetical protein [Acidobacteriota bacterium]